MPIPFSPVHSPGCVEPGSRAASPGLRDQTQRSTRIPAVHPNATSLHGGPIFSLWAAMVAYSKKGQINILRATKSLQRQWLNSSINQPEAVRPPADSLTLSSGTSFFMGELGDLQGYGKTSLFSILVEPCAIYKWFRKSRQTNRHLPLLCSPQMQNRWPLTSAVNA